MRIALDCRSAFKGMGGIGRYTWCLLEELLSRDLSNEYVCYFTHLEPPKPLNINPRLKLRVSKCGMIDERFDQFILPELLLEDEIDVYHNPTFAVPIIRTSAKTIATIHDVVFLRHPDLVEPRLRSYLSAATQRSVKHADALITVSEFSSNELVELCDVDRSKIRVIYNGIALPQPSSGVTDPTELRNLGLEGKTFILYVGSIEPKKNLNLLFEAFHILGRNYPDLHLVLAGSRSTEDTSLDSWLLKPDLKQKVHLLGHVSEAALEALYRGSFVFVYPSLYEGFGFPPLEAMARGIPAIVSNCSSLPEVVAGGAVLVDPHQPTLLADEIAKMFKDPQWYGKYASRGKKRALQFTWSRSAQEHLALYNSVYAKRYENCAPRV